MEEKEAKLNRSVKKTAKTMMKKKIKKLTTCFGENAWHVRERLTMTLSTF